MPRPLADYVDPARRPATVLPGGVDALVAMCDPPINRDQAAFAAFVMNNSGVFLTAQVESWLDASRPGWCDDPDPKVRRDWSTRWVLELFLPSFVRNSRLVVTKSVTGVRGRNLAHFGYATAYAALGIRESRYRRAPTGALALQRLLLFDYVVSHLPGITWYGATYQKEQFFGALGVPSALFPSTVYTGDTGPDTRRYFPDHMPIGVSDWSVTFPVALTDDFSLQSSVNKIKPYEKLFAALRSLGIAVHVAIVLRRVDGGEWQRRLAAHWRPRDPEDRLRLIDAVELYLIRRLLVIDDPGLVRTYGGSVGVRRRVAELEASLRVPVADGGAMSLDIWYAERFSTGPWASPMLKSARVL